MTLAEEPVIRLLQKCNGDFVGAAKLMNVAPDIFKAHVVRITGKHDEGYFAEYCLKIRTKDGVLTPLKLNRGQRKILDAIRRQRKAGKPVRIKLLKARQFGGSTFTQGEFYRDLTYSDHKQYLTVCHELDSARNMRAMLDRFNTNCPIGSLPHKNVSDKWWKFPEKDSDYLIDTADELDTGRSFTTHRLHASEIAFYRDPDTLMLGLLQSVPDTPDTMVVVESTANGIGDYFHKFILADNGYELVFVGAHEHDEYRTPFVDENGKLQFEHSMDETEHLYHKSGIPLEVLRWRRDTISAKMNGDAEKFKQEFPFTPDEAFLTSGRPYFAMGVVRKELLRTMDKRPEQGYIQDKDGDTMFIPDGAGPWKIFERPKSGYEYRYVTGSDAAEGKADTSNKDPDYSVCTVRDRLTGKEVARFHMRCDTDVFAEEIYKGSLLYQSACDAIERNGPGLAVIGQLKDRLPNLYRKMVLGKTEELETAEYGYHTTTDSRETLLSDLRSRIRKSEYATDDHEFWKECASFVFDKTGKPAAQPGTHDDMVISAALSVQAQYQANELHAVERPESPVETDRTDKVWATQEEEIDPVATF